MDGWARVWRKEMIETRKRCWIVALISCHRGSWIHVKDFQGAEVDEWQYSWGGVQVRHVCI